jgi:hypothetical protein
MGVIPASTSMMGALWDIADAKARDFGLEALGTSGGPAR